MLTIDKSKSLGRKCLGKEILGEIRSLESYQIYQGPLESTHIPNAGHILRKDVRRPKGFTSD